MNNISLLIIFLLIIIIGTSLNVKIERFNGNSIKNEQSQDNSIQSHYNQNKESNDDSNQSVQSQDISNETEINQSQDISNETQINQSHSISNETQDYQLDNVSNETQDNQLKDISNKTKVDQSQVDQNKLRQNIDINLKKIEDIKKLKKFKNIKINTPTEEYYDYKYTINNTTPNNQCNQQPININLNYPTSLSKDEDIEYRERPYNTSLLQNLTGTPVDQVETSYSVNDENNYKSWDNYYLPGYSYFPPSTWQLPKDNSYIIPKEMKSEKCDVCPLVSVNDYGNFLSGDNILYQSKDLPPIPDLPNTTKIVEKKIVTKKIKKK